jgi:hypothetical protein
MEIEKTESEDAIILHPLFNKQSQLKVRQARRAWLVNRPRFMISSEIEKVEESSTFKIKVSSTDDHI